MEAQFESAVNSGQIPGAVLLAKDATGHFDYKQAFGARTVRHDGGGKLPPLETDTPVRFGQACQLITSIMVLQCVERGVIGLDDDVERYLPELTSMNVVLGFDDTGNAITRRREGAITLRHLLTHTSGLAYVPITPLLQEYIRKGCMPSVSASDLPNPLPPPTLPPVKDPGTEWIYGPNLDWAGRLIERATGMDLERYMQENVCSPLNITDMTFRLQARPDLVARRADNTTRNRDDGQLRHDESPHFRRDPDECFGGYGIFGSAESFMKVLHALLRNDGTLLRPETVRLMFQPALDERVESQMNQHMDRTAPFINYGGPIPPTGVRRNFGLAGMILMEDLDGHHWRRKGSMAWGGGPNIIWQIDPTARLCTLAVFQLEPWNDTVCQSLIRSFEKTIYLQTQGA